MPQRLFCVIYKDANFMQIDLFTFHQRVGQTIMYCQLIEHDIKIIYAKKKGGEFDAAYSGIAEKTLGQAVSELRELDVTRRLDFFTPEDYDILFSVAETRNYWCHTAYTDFAYEKDFRNSKAYADACARLDTDSARIAALFKAVQKLKMIVVGRS